MLREVEEASLARLDRLAEEEIDSRVDLLLSHYESVTADPKKMAYLRPLLKHYAKFQHPFAQCQKDNMRRFGPGKTEAICGVLKDILRQNVYWRHGPHGHSKVPDAGAPGVAIAEADKGAAHWGGHRMSEGERVPSLLDHLDETIGVVDHTEGVVGAMDLIVALGERCDVYRVLLGLDDPPALNL